MLLAAMLAMALMMAAPATVMAGDFDGGIDEDVVCVVEFEVEDFD